MASRGKKKTTMAKLSRESRLRERRIDKQARKEARKLGLLPSRDETADARPDEAADMPVEAPGELEPGVSPLASAD
jgi:hypothetical protein